MVRSASACGACGLPATGSGAEATQPATAEVVVDDADADVESTRSDALDSYVEAERAQIVAMAGTLDDIYSDVTVEAIYPDTVVFSYVYIDQVDQKSAQESLDGLAPTLQTLVDTAVAPGMKKLGVSGSPKAVYTYINADGSEVWTRTFE